MNLPPINPDKDATYQITLGSTFDDTPRQSFHGLKCICSGMVARLTHAGYRQLQACRN
jgi:hypothetical protein